MPDLSQPQDSSNISDEAQPALLPEAALWPRSPIAVAANKPPARVKLVQRDQVVIRTLDVERLLEPEHPARAIWELLGKCDLSHFYGVIAAVQGQAGRSPHDPRLLISLWLYSYMKSIVSAREIERRCAYDPAYIWLTGAEKVCAHTLSDYRTANEKALKDLFIQHLAVLEKAGLVDLQQVTQDGTKISAAAGADTFRRKATIEEHLQRAQKRVEELNQAAANEQENESHSQRALAAQQRAAREQLETLEKALAEVEELQKTAKEPEKVRVSITDPEARIMQHSNGGYSPSYNLQLTTDTQQTVVVSVEVTQDYNDAEQLQPAIERLQEEAGQAPEQVIADGSYTNRGNIVTMEQNHIDLIGPVPDGSVQKETLYQIRGVTAEFRPEAFHFDAERNCYTCPAGKSLPYQRKNLLPGQTKYFYQARREDCQSCVHRPQCCSKSKSGRSVVRAEDSAEVNRFRAKMESEAAKAIYRKRGPVAEFPNLCIKERFGLRRFSVRGLAKVKIEGLWVAFTFNVQQWIRLCWLPGTLQNSSAA